MFRAAFALSCAVGGTSGASFWGTLEYVAPEVVRFGSAAYSPAADWWGLGVMVYELLLGLAPWDGNDADEMMEQIKAADVVWPPEGMVSLPAPFAGDCRHPVSMHCWAH